MSGDFLSDDELAELEAELSELEDSSETDGASEEALEEVPPRDEADEKAVEEVATEEPVQVDEDADLEAELNAVAAGHEGDDESDDEAMESVEQAAEQVADEQANKEKAEIEAKRAAEEKAQAAAEQAAQNRTAANNSDSEDESFSRMFTDTGSSFDPRQLQKDIAINENNLDDAFISQAGLFAHYAGIAHRAARRHDQLAQQLKLVEAKLDQEIRQKAADDGEKVTEAAIKNRILLDSRHRKMVERVHDAKAVAAMTKDGCESFKQRRDMLIQVGANVREEQKGELRMKAAQESRDSMTDRAVAALQK